MVSGLENAGKVVSYVNKLFYESVTPGFFATMFLWRITSMATRRLRYVNCGHCPAFLVRADGTCDELGSTATVLGMFENWNCTVGEAPCRPATPWWCIPTGLTEARRRVR